MHVHCTALQSELITYIHTLHFTFLPPDSNMAVNHQDKTGKFRRLLRNMLIDGFVLSNVLILSEEILLFDPHFSLVRANQSFNFDWLAGQARPSDHYPKALS